MSTSSRVLARLASGDWAAILGDSQMAVGELSEEKQGSCERA